MVAGVTRAGASYCALRLRAHDDEQSVVNGTELVPGLLDLLHATLHDTSHDLDEPSPAPTRTPEAMSNPFDRPSGPTGPDGPQRPGGNGGSGGARPATRHADPARWSSPPSSSSSPSCSQRLRVLLDRAAVVRLRRLPGGLHDAPAHPHRAVLRLRRADGRRRRGGDGDGLPLPARPVARHAGMPDDGMDRYRQLVAPRMGWVIGVLPRVMGLFAGASASGQWRSYSLWRHSKEFGTTDPYFNKDVGFYVFDLPFWHYLVDFVMALAVVGLIASLLMNYLFGGIRLSARPGERLTSAAQIQVSALLALFVLAKAVDYWLDRFDLVTNSGSIFTGMGYTDDKAVLPAKEILAGIAIVCALLFLANIWRRTWLLPSVGVALFALSAIILGLIVPTLVQAIRVNPNVPDREGPYIKANIDATRAAYQLDQIDVRDVASTAVADDDELGSLEQPDRRASRSSTRRSSARSSSSSSRSAPTTRCPTCSTSTATRSTARTAPWCWACASSTRAASPRATRTGPTSTPPTPTATA